MAQIQINIGSLGEKIVARHLKSKGHSVLEHGSRAGKLELDLYTKDGGGVFHLVEVKTSAVSVCSCDLTSFTMSEKTRRRLPIRSAKGWAIRISSGDGARVSPIDSRFNHKKLFHMKQLAMGKQVSVSGSSSFSVDYARVELCFLHRVGIITLFENVEL